MKKEFSAGTDAQSSTTADNSTSASVEASPMLSAALSVEDANILIAKFTGFVVKDFGAAFTRYTFSDNEDAPYYDWFLCRDLEYNSSLDWLKPAIDAFINLDISVFNYNIVTMSEFRQVRQSLSNMPISKSIDDFFNELVTAIVWYNSAVSVGSSQRPAYLCPAAIGCNEFKTTVRRWRKYVCKAQGG